MNQLINALQKQQNITTTTNGAKAFKSTKSACLDLFASWGGMRGKNIKGHIAAALNENTELTCRIALWGRDVREGAGERQLFRDFLQYLAFNNYKECEKLLHKVPELGRWDDLLTLFNTPVWSVIPNIIWNALQANNQLCAKWMPRKGRT